MILTVCQRGNVRSATLATVLKDYYGQKDVIPVGYETTSPDVMKHLCDLATVVFITKSGMEAHIPPHFYHKVVLVDIGDDIWGQPMHPEIVRRCLEARLVFIHSPRVYESAEVYAQANERVFYAKR